MTTEHLDPAAAAGGKAVDSFGDGWSKSSETVPLSIVHGDCVLNHGVSPGSDGEQLDVGTIIQIGTLLLIFYELGPGMVQELDCTVHCLIFMGSQSLI